MFRADLAVEAQDDAGAGAAVYTLANLYSPDKEDCPKKVVLKAGQPITDAQAEHGFFSFVVTIFSPFKTIVHRQVYDLPGTELLTTSDVPRELLAIFLTSMNGERSVTHLPNPVTWDFEYVRIVSELQGITMPQKRDFQADRQVLIKLRERRRAALGTSKTLNLDAVHNFIEESLRVRAALKAELAEITMTPPDMEPNTPTNIKLESLELAKEQACAARRNVLTQYYTLIYRGASLIKPFRYWLHDVLLDSAHFLQLQMLVYRLLISRAGSKAEHTGSMDNEEEQCIAALKAEVDKLDLAPDVKDDVERQLPSFILFVKLSTELATLYLNTSIVSDLIDFSDNEANKQMRHLGVAICICRPFTKAWIKLSKLYRRCGKTSNSLNIISTCVQLLKTFDHEQEALKRKVMAEHKMAIQQLKSSTLTLNPSQEAGTQA